jgi:hypothetical protein
LRKRKEKKKKKKKRKIKNRISCQGFIVNHQGFEIIGREEFEFQLLLQGMFLFDRLFDQLPHI